MRACVQKWGNSLALRIPRAFVQEVGLKQDAPVDVSVTNGKLVVTPVTAPTFTLDELLAGVTKRNLHGEMDFGDAVGREVW